MTRDCCLAACKSRFFFSLLFSSPFLFLLYRSFSPHLTSSSLRFLALTLFPLLFSFHLSISPLLSAHIPPLCLAYIYLFIYFFTSVLCWCCLVPTASLSLRVWVCARSRACVCECVRFLLTSLLSVCKAGWCSCYTSSVLHQDYMAHVKPVSSNAWSNAGWHMASSMQVCVCVCMPALLKLDLGFFWKFFADVILIKAII